MKKIALRALTIVKLNPIEFFTTASFIVITIVKQLSLGSISTASYYLYTSLLVVYAINALSTSRVFYYLSAVPSLVAIWLAFWCEHEFSVSSMAVTSLCALLFLMVAKGDVDNRNFVIQSGNILKNLILASFTSGVINSLIFALLASLDSVFETKLVKESFVWLLILGIYINTPLAFLFFERRSRNISMDGKGNFCGILINYILSPATLIYGVVLYIYFAKIILAWSLPDGGIALTSILFIIIGLTTKCCREALQKPNLEYVFRYFTLLSLPAIIMMWISAWVRISEYGMTQNRGYLVVFLTIATLWCGAMLHEKSYNFRWLTAISISIMTFYNLLALFIF